jgi:hypothetical protein
LKRRQEALLRSGDWAIAKLDFVTPISYAASSDCELNASAIDEPLIHSFNGVRQVPAALKQGWWRMTTGVQSGVQIERNRDQLRATQRR